MTEAVTDKPVFRLVVPGVDGSGDEVFEADSQDALNTKLAEAKQHATRKIREQAAELELLKAPAPVQSAAAGDFDTQAWFNKMYSNPLDAIDTWAEERFGLPVPALAERLREMGEVTQAQQDLMVQGKFAKAHPELLQVPPEDDLQNSKEIYGIMNERKWEHNVGNLEAAYAVAKERGKLKLPSAVAASADADATPVPPITITSTTGAQGESVDVAHFIKTAPIAEVEKFMQERHRR